MCYESRGHGDADDAMKKKPTLRKRKPPSLAALDLTLRLDEKGYLAELARVQERLRQIQRAYLKSGNSAAIVFEGWDAAGKGGTIRCMSAVLDPRGFKVWPISAPRKYISSGTIWRASSSACHRVARSPSSTDPGTGVFSSNGSRDWRA